MKIIQGKQAVVTQIRTRKAEQGKPAEAVCRGVSEAVYQKLHYHSVQPAAGRENVPVVLNGEPVDQQDGGVPVTARVSGIHTKGNDAAGVVSTGEGIEEKNGNGRSYITAGYKAGQNI